MQYRNSSRDLLIELRDVWFRYPLSSTWCIRGVNLRIHREEVLVLVGKNASGKTTLLRLIAGIEKPQRGNIIRYTEGTYYIPQDPAIVLTKEVVSKYIHKLPRPDIVLEVVKYLGLEDSLEKSPLVLSLGQRRCLAIALALGMDVDLLLVDEPTLGLDNVVLVKLARVLRTFIEQGRLSLVIATQDLEFAEHLGVPTRAVLVDCGRIVLEGDLQTVARIWYGMLRVVKVPRLCTELGLDVVMTVDRFFERYLMC